MRKKTAVMQHADVLLNGPKMLRDAIASIKAIVRSAKARMQALLARIWAGTKIPAALDFACMTAARHNRLLLAALIKSSPLLIFTVIALRRCIHRIALASSKLEIVASALSGVYLALVYTIVTKESYDAILKRLENTDTDKEAS